MSEVKGKKGGGAGRGFLLVWEKARTMHAWRKEGRKERAKGGNATSEDTTNTIVTLLTVTGHLYILFPELPPSFLTHSLPPLLPLQVKENSPSSLCVTYFSNHLPPLPSAPSLPLRRQSGCDFTPSWRRRRPERGRPLSLLPPSPFLPPPFLRSSH